VVVAWPEGRPIRVTPPVGPDRLRLAIGARGDWFSATGKLELEGDLVLDLGQLLDLLERHPGRFVPLGDERFLALTAAFRKRLDELRAFSERDAGGVRFSPFATLALDPLTDEAGDVRGDAAWTRHRARLSAAFDRDPAVPATFQGELRDYQLEGYRWLARLAEWGVGACLADDMGLGKTVQALALVLSRARLGPTLVVAPTSVLHNWVHEAARFAPTLRVQALGGRDRGQTTAALGPFDVLVTTYGLLHQEADLLAAVDWQVVVLDEAHAIKNAATRRSQAAMRLRAAFRLATTGTPVENHLGELWNLFRFLVPGLLGSREAFDERFALPIERDGDRQARHRLKRLVQPFLLRRTKGDVLDELPARTDITLKVALSPEEAALYEAQRRRALEKLDAAKAPAGQRSLQILAEITRLRRLCCDPRLVLPDAGVAGSKLAVLTGLLSELLAGRHKALVFSQFVDHLALARAELDRSGVAYQYLDGATPAAERARRVAAFQAGEGDVFLISLRAGGVGLNLTAADYVVHLDPWWNPAVEDQASDRAHRIGQQRPVTVYRLVAEHTIEEAIVALHQRKRDLADSLLEGADTAGRLDAEELLCLIREQP
jgi:SNF2 family DNA or RNA helicase